MRSPAILLCLCLFLSCGDESGKNKNQGMQSDGNTVVTTFYPMQYFSERIAGDLLNIECPLPKGADPIFWRPDAAALQKFQAADLIIVNGAEFEKWIGTVSLPESRIVDTAKSFAQDFIRYESSTTHKLPTKLHFHPIAIVPHPHHSVLVAWHPPP